MQYDARNNQNTNQRITRTAPWKEKPKCNTVQRMKSKEIELLEHCKVKNRLVNCSDGRNDMW